MDGEVKCPDERVNKIQFDNINKNVDKITEIQEATVSRVVVLERNNTVMANEFANMQKSQDALQILTLKLDRETNAKIDYQFANLLTSISKTEDRNDKKFTKIEEGQDTIMSKLGEIQTDKNGKLELSKGKMVMYGLIIVAIITIIPACVVLFL
ncbi:hypothetical protein [Clostridium sp.]|uniref:hypothetical protein n=1 Tax=Clostridium sp. TaxID=1506 RepID=UPI001A494FB0|nr:hypothetical protein [Clostridium sp.]MBK5239848.1 hypothetical protein [Clostridium sp.]